MSSSSTYTSVQIQNVLPKDVTYSVAKKHIYKQNEATGEFARGLWEFKHNYKKRYTKKFLEKNNMILENRLSAIDIDDNKVETYINVLYFNGTAPKEQDDPNALLPLDTRQQIRQNLSALDYSDKLLSSDTQLINVSAKRKIAPLNEISLFYLQMNEQPKWDLADKTYTVNKDAPEYEEEVDENGQPTGKLVKKLDNNGNEIIINQDITYDEYLFAFNDNNDPLVNNDLSKIIIYFFVKAALPDNFGYTQDEIDALDDFQKHTIEFDNDFKEDTLTVVFQVGSNNYYHIFKDDEEKFFLRKDNDILLQPIVVLKYEDQLRVYQDAVEKVIKQFGMKSKDLAESLSQTDDNGNQLIKTAAITQSVELCDIYKYKPGTYRSDIAKQFPPKLLKRMTPDTNGENYTLTQEVADWWRERNKFKAYEYLNMLYFMIRDYYNSGTYDIIWQSPDDQDIKYTTTIERTHTIHNAVLLGAYYNGQVSKRYAEIEEKDNAVYIRKQLTETTYGELKITKLEQSLYISGEWFIFKSDGGWLSSSDKHDRCFYSDDSTMRNNECYFRTPDFASGSNDSVCYRARPRLFIPADILKNVPFYRYLVANEYGITLMTYSEFTEDKDFTKDILMLGFAVGTCIFAPTLCGWAINTTTTYFIAKAATYAISNILYSITRDRVASQIIASATVGLIGGYIDSGTLLNLQSALTITKAIYGFVEYDKQKELIHEKFKEGLAKSSKEIEESIENFNKAHAMSHLVASPYMNPSSYADSVLNTLTSFDLFLNCDSYIKSQLALPMLR